MNYWIYIVALGLAGMLLISDVWVLKLMGLGLFGVVLVEILTE